jgi:hypothetical protein
VTTSTSPDTALGHRLQDDALGYLSMELKSFYVQPTQGEEKDTDEQVKSLDDLDELLGMSTTSVDFDVASVEGDGQLQAYMQVQQVPNDTDPLMWWKQYQEEFPDLSRMAGQYLAVPATSSSPERFFSRVGLVQTDLRGRRLDTLTDTPIHIHFPLCLTHQYNRSTVTLSTPHTWSYLTNYQPC